jgi:hypothetical protein
LLYVEFAVGEGYLAALGLDVGEGFQDVSNSLVADAEIVEFRVLAVWITVRIEQAAAIRRDSSFRSEVCAVA